MKIKVLITVEGGIVQSVDSNIPIEYIVIDYDKQSDEPVIVGKRNTPDNVVGIDGKFYELFKGKLDKDELFVFKKLKRLNF